MNGIVIKFDYSGRDVCGVTNELLSCPLSGLFPLAILIFFFLPLQLLWL